jgi:RimJ/RimL family protein N-acetyltransferase
MTVKSTFRNTKRISRKSRGKSPSKSPVKKTRTHPHRSQPAAGSVFLKSLAVITAAEIVQLARITSDPETMKWIGKGKTWSVADIEEFRNDEHRERGLPHNRRRHYTYIMMLGSNVIGFIEGRKSREIQKKGFGNVNDLLLRMLISRDYMGQGYGKMIIKLFLELYSRMIKPKSPAKSSGQIAIYSDIDPENIGSIKIHLANGFKFIGTYKYSTGKFNNRYRKII